MFTQVLVLLLEFFPNTDTVTRICTRITVRIGIDIHPNVFVAVRIITRICTCIRTPIDDINVKMHDKILNDSP